MAKECPNCASRWDLEQDIKDTYAKDVRKRLVSINTHRIKKDFALFLYIHCNGIRQISRILKVAPSLVLFWIKKAQEKLKGLIK
ncbi:MAG: hypothetical protein LBF23_03645 [Endomicrobium sp.]|jgi:transposase-like protein|nr:hypothetical protein [Endomicrobium sp.]